MDGQVDLASSAQVLDVAIPAVLGTAWDRSRSLTADLGLELSVGASGVHVLGIRKLGNNTIELVGGDELSFTAVPLGEDGSTGCTTEDTRVDETGEADVWNVSGGAEDPFEVPDRLCSAAKVPLDQHLSRHSSRHSGPARLTRSGRFHPENRLHSVGQRRR